MIVKDLLTAILKLIASGDLDENSSILIQDQGSSNYATPKDIKPAGPENGPTTLIIQK